MASGSPSGSPAASPCPICMESSKNTTTTSCNHTFCTPCINRWTRERSDCPLCRGVLFTVQITVIRKCLRKYLKGHMRSFALDKSVLEHVLQNNLLCFRVPPPRPHNMSRNFVIFEYAGKRYEVSFKYFNNHLRASLFGRSKSEQADVIVSALFESTSG